jgi:hypothetical protein
MDNLWMVYLEPGLIPFLCRPSKRWFGWGAVVLPKMTIQPSQLP